MRNTFAAELTELARLDDRIVLLSGDIGNRLFDDFKAQNGGRFFNCGVAEANLMTMAAGMALSGLRPVAYTITPFITTRCLEQIRVDVCYHGAPVVIVGTGSGLAYGALGATHHSLEDIGFLRLLPTMTVVCPGDPVEVRLALRAALAVDGPVYLRIGKKGEPVVHRAEPDFEIGRGIELRAGEDIWLLSTGAMLPVAVEVSDRLADHGIDAGVVSHHTVKPLDDELLRRVFASSRFVATVEEHSVIGGLGGAVAEWKVDREAAGEVGPALLLRFGTPDRFLHEPGEQDYAREHLGISPEAITESILRAWKSGAAAG